MKQKFIILVILAMYLPLSVLAEQGQKINSNGSTDNGGINRMAKDLGLSEEQKVQVQAIFNDEKQAVEVVFKEQGEKLKAIQQQTHNKLQQVFSPEQLNKFDKKIQQQEKRNKVSKH